jgi:hypothetical protein
MSDRKLLGANQFADLIGDLLVEPLAVNGLKGHQFSTLDGGMNLALNVTGSAGRCQYAEQNETGTTGTIA